MMSLNMCRSQANRSKRHLVLTGGLLHIIRPSDKKFSVFGGHLMSMNFLPRKQEGPYARSLSWIRIEMVKGIK